MFDAVRNNQRVAQTILALLIIPFAFFGLDAYFQDNPGTAEVAVVGSTRISAAEFDNALREQQERLRARAGGEADRALLESEDLRRAVLENLVNQRVMALYSAENRFTVSPAQLQQTIAEIPAFQQDGRFSLQRYETVLRSQGMTPAMFEARLAQDVRIQQVARAVGEAGFVPAASARRFLGAQLEERSIRELRFPAARQLAAVKLSDEEITRFHEQNPALFERPARLRAEYVVFDAASVEKQVSITDAEIRSFYDSNPARFGVGEERQARHILLPLEAGASADEVQKQTARAQELLSQLRKDPAQFAALAKAHSQDPGSAARGGDLGYFGRGVMVPAFDEAVFARSKGEIGEPVRSDFGLHLIQVTDIKPATVRPFEQVRGEILAELRTQAAARKYAELAEQFANLVYEQPDSLAPAAEALKLELKRSDWIVRGSEALGPYRNPRLMTALFADEAVRDRRNTEAIEVGNKLMLAARVTDFEPAQRPPLQEVRDEIVSRLRSAEASKRAAEEGAAVLASLNKGEALAGEWTTARMLQRGAPGLPVTAMQAVFAAPTTRLPTQVGVTMPDGDYVIFRIEAVNRPALDDKDPRLAMVGQQYAQLLAERDFSAFLSELRKRYKVELKLPPARSAD